mmetsp:Transcript_3140/g.9576  ORF Transcript_3140/g.9576 Transcript_3140/m.9576 type:complete len:540 (-) Transcript_3140:50-1669(-)
MQLLEDEEEAEKASAPTRRRSRRGSAPVVEDGGELGAGRLAEVVEVGVEPVEVAGEVADEGGEEAVVGEEEEEAEEGAEGGGVGEPVEALCLGVRLFGVDPVGVCEGEDGGGEHEADEARQQRWGPEEVDEALDAVQEQASVVELFGDAGDRLPDENRSEGFQRRRRRAAGNTPQTLLLRRQRRVLPQVPQQLLGFRGSRRRHLVLSSFVVGEEASSVQLRHGRGDEAHLHVDGSLQSGRRKEKRLQRDERRGPGKRHQQSEKSERRDEGKQRARADLVHDSRPRHRGVLLRHEDVEGARLAAHVAGRRRVSCLDGLAHDDEIRRARVRRFREAQAPVQRDGRGRIHTRRQPDIRRIGLGAVRRHSDFVLDPRHEVARHAATPPRLLDAHVLHPKGPPSHERRRRLRSHDARHHLRAGHRVFRKGDGERGFAGHVEEDVRQRIRRPQHFAVLLRRRRREALAAQRRAGLKIGLRRRQTQRVRRFFCRGWCLLCRRRRRDLHDRRLHSRHSETTQRGSPERPRRPSFEEQQQQQRRHHLG